MDSMQLSPRVRCSACPSCFPIGDNCIDAYFRGHKLRCPSCHKDLDTWLALFREIRDNFLLTYAFYPLGARSTIFDIQLKANQRTQYRFSDHGIPSDAKVVYVNYTPYTPGGGGLFPLEIHGNVVTRRTFSDLITLFPAPLGDHTSSFETEVSVHVTWIPSAADDIAWTNLVTAFEEYGSERYEAAIVPANVAVESMVARFLIDFLPDHLGRSRTEEFVRGATYSDQLNVVLPLATSLGGFPKLPNHIRGGLNRLKDLRNEIAHHGRPKNTLGKEEAATVLAAALFGFRYVRLLEREHRDDTKLVGR